jgi:hypothetical protein
VAAIAIHVVDLYVVATGDGYAIVLVYDDAVAYCGVVRGCQTKAYRE